MKSLAGILLLSTFFSLAGGALILLEKDYFNENYRSEKYSVDILKQGRIGLYRYWFNKLTREQRQVLLYLTPKEWICLKDFPLFATKKDEKAWLEVGCYNFTSTRNEKIRDMWADFVHDLPTSFSDPFKKATNNVIEQKLFMDDPDQTKQFRFVLEYLKAMKEVLNLPESDRQYIGYTKILDLHSVLGGDLYDPSLRIIDPLIELFELAAKNKELGLWRTAWQLPNLFRVYKHGLKLSLAYKKFFMKQADREMRMPSQFQITNLMMMAGIETEEDELLVMGRIFDLVDAYEELCFGSHSWYQFGTHIEKMLTC